jgi:hypothetical protein
MGLDLTLRSRQVQYLEYIAERDDLPLSHALEKVLSCAMSAEAPETSRRTVKIRKHFSLGVVHIEFLDTLAARLGLLRSDVARRLIDEARAKNQTI